jgi:hypothetical protein
VVCRRGRSFEFVGVHPVLKSPRRHTMNSVRPACHTLHPINSQPLRGPRFRSTEIMPSQAICSHELHSFGERDSLRFATTI